MRLAEGLLSSHARAGAGVCVQYRWGKTWGKVAQKKCAGESHSLAFGFGLGHAPQFQTTQSFLYRNLIRSSLIKCLSQLSGGGYQVAPSARPDAPKSPRNPLEGTTDPPRTKPCCLGVKTPPILLKEVSTDSS
mgnify:CR=1 FL=1